MLDLLCKETKIPTFHPLGFDLGLLLCWAFFKPTHPQVDPSANAKSLAVSKKRYIEFGLKKPKSGRHIGIVPSQLGFFSPFGNSFRNNGIIHIG